MAAFALVLAAAAALVTQWRQLCRDRAAALTAAADADRQTLTLFDTMLDAILIIGPDGKIERTSRTATRLLGYGDGDLAGRNVSGIIDLAPGSYSFGSGKGALRRPFRTDVATRHRDGRELMVDVALDVMSQSGTDRLLVSLREVSERTRIERVAAALAGQIGTELHAPLHALAAMLGDLRAGHAGPLSSQAARLTAIAEADARRLAGLVDGLLAEPVGGSPARRPIDVGYYLQAAAAPPEPAYS